MRKYSLFLLSLLFMLPAILSAQTSKQARQILDKTAAQLGNRSGVEANFSFQSGKYGSASGTIAIKGKKFRASTAQGTTWFDGKTQWTYMKNSGEVNVSTPNQAQQMRMNPYTFINIYKKGYRLSAVKSGFGWQVTMKAIHPGSSIQEIILDISSAYMPQKIKMKQGKQWTNITVSGLRKANLADSYFKFNSKDYPKAEVIDLR